MPQWSMTAPLAGVEPPPGLRERGLRAIERLCTTRVPRPAPLPDGKPFRVGAVHEGRAGVLIGREWNVGELARMLLLNPGLPLIVRPGRSRTPQLFWIEGGLFLDEDRTLAECGVQEGDQLVPCPPTGSDWEAKVRAHGIRPEEMVSHDTGFVRRWWEAALAEAAGV